MNTTSKRVGGAGVRAVGLVTLGALLVTGCGSLIDMGRNEKVNPRRVYLNDAAANDSLPATLATEGLLLVMQARGKQYTLRTAAGNAENPLDLYARNAGGGFSYQQSITGTAVGGAVHYALSAPPSKSVADYYLVFLRGTGGMPVTKPDSVKLLPVDTAQSATVSVRLHMVHQLAGLQTDSAKSVYATAFHRELKDVFLAQGVTVDTSTAIVEPTAAPLTVVFNGDEVALPGVRRDGAINIYLVNSIEGGAVGSSIVGFAPREAFDLSANPESRIVLNVQGSTAAELAVTAAHEMGHFLGLRHTSATLTDRGFDKDDSNRDDGFTTFYCSVLEKRSVAGEQEIIAPGPGDRPYCLRVAGTAVDCRSACTDRTNLMYPYRCEVPQKTLEADQRRVMRNILKVFQ